MEDSQEDTCRNEITYCFEVCEEMEPNLFIKEFSPKFEGGIVAPCKKIRVILDSEDENQTELESIIIKSKKENKFTCHSYGVNEYYALDHVKHTDIKTEEYDDWEGVTDSTCLNTASKSDKIISEIKRTEPFIGLQLLGVKDEFNKCLHCNYCDFTTVFKGNLARHIKRKHSHFFKQRMSCHLCDYKCAFPYELSIHALKHKGQHLFQCFFCVFGVNKKCRIVRHTHTKHPYNSVSGEFNRNIKCYCCAFKTDVRVDLLNHILTQHFYKPKTGKGSKTVYQVSKKPVYSCKLCSYASPCKSTLRVHVDGFHKKIRLHECKLCNYRAGRRSDLQIHISAKHLKLIPFKCDYCHYASAYKKHLRRHVVTQHINKKTRKSTTKYLELILFKCDYCHYTSAYKRHLRRHIINQHIIKKARKSTRKLGKI